METTKRSLIYVLYINYGQIVIGQCGIIIYMHIEIYKTPTNV